MTQQPRILIADDHQVVAEGLSRLLGEQFTVVDIVTDGQRVCEAATRLRPDAILIDLSMPNVSGVQVIHQLKKAGMTAKTIVLTMYADPALAVEALAAGASGFVLKESSAEEILSALHTVLGGGTYLAPAMTKDIVSVMVGAEGKRVELTPQQREVLRLIVGGMRAKEIAATLDLTTRSVEAIKYRMMQQLDVHSTAELVRYAVEHRLVPV